jgi:5'-nucleotidase
MHLMLSNDDGVDAAGLHAMRRAFAEARPDWKLSVIAPDREQSGTSHSLTLTQPLRIEERGERVWAVSGTPTDCVLIGYESILGDDPPDAVISGINHGPNMGEDVHYSGTVAAAFEGRLLGLPAVALSLGSRELRFGASEDFIRSHLVEWLEQGLPPGSLLNVNIPSGSSEDIRGIRPCRLGSRRYTDVVVRKEDPRGREYFWIAGDHRAVENAPDTDLVLVREGWIAVTPLQIDLTDHAGLSSLDRYRADW